MYNVEYWHYEMLTKRPGLRSKKVIYNRVRCLTEVCYDCMQKTPRDEQCIMHDFAIYVLCTFRY